MQRKRVKIKEYQGSFETKMVDGKTAIIFDDKPALLYFSTDDTFQQSMLFINGVSKPEISAMKIEGSIDEIVRVTTEMSLVLCVE